MVPFDGPHIIAHPRGMGDAACNGHPAKGILESRGYDGVDREEPCNVSSGV